MMGGGVMVDDGGPNFFVGPWKSSVMQLAISAGS